MIFRKKVKTCLHIKNEEKTQIFFLDQITGIEIEGLKVKVFMNSGIDISTILSSQEEVDNLVKIFKDK